jgi:hypothetical protein
LPSAVTQHGYARVARCGVLALEKKRPFAGWIPSASKYPAVTSSPKMRRGSLSPFKVRTSGGV